MICKGPAGRWLPEPKEVVMHQEGLFIGELAKQVGMTTKAIRHYEGLGLLSPPRRTDSGYRVYAGEDVERLRFIQGAKGLGFSLQEIKDIIGLWSSGERPCGMVSRMLQEKLADLDRRISLLTTFRDELAAYKSRMDEQGSPDVPCAHIEGLASGQWKLPSLEAADTTPLKGHGGCCD